MKDFIDQLLKKKEGERTDFKLTVPRREALGQILCSFANGRGGTLVIGVDENGIPIGIPDAKLVAQALGRDAASILSPAISVSTNVILVSGNAIVLVDVPEGADKPYTFMRQVYIRRGDKTEKADIDDIRHLLNLMPRFEIRWERRLAPGFQVSGLDDNEVEGAAISARDNFGIEVALGAESITKLEQLGLASNGQLHNGAVVLFAHEPHRVLPQIRVHAICFADEDENRVLDNRLFEGHAFHLLQEAVKFIQNHVPVTGDISGKTLDRGDKRAVPMVAVREALLNALQHRDYEAYDGSIIIKITPAGISIWNPGDLPEGMKINELKRVHYSRPRNPDIAHVFFLRGLVERIGSGTTRVLTALRSAGLPDAEWIELSGGIEVFLGYRKSLSGLNDRQQSAVGALAEGDLITVAEYLERFGKEVTDRQARSDLMELVKRGLLVRKGSARATKYERTTKRR